MGREGLGLQEKSKQAVHRIIRKMDDMNELAKDELEELQKQNE